MKTAIVKIGNSRGIRIPKPVLKQCGFEDEVDMVINHHELIIRPLRQPRDGWDKSFQTMAEHGDDALLDSDHPSQTSWDKTEWEWE